MSFTIEIFENEPIILVTIHEDFRVGEHQALSDAESLKYLEEADEPLFHIVDLTNFKPTFNDIMAGANTGTRGKMRSGIIPRTAYCCSYRKIRSLKQL